MQKLRARKPQAFATLFSVLLCLLISKNLSGPVHDAGKSIGAGSRCRDYIGAYTNNCLPEPLSVDEIVMILRTSQVPFVVIPNYWSSQKATTGQKEATAALHKCAYEDSVGDTRRMLGLEHGPHFPLAWDLMQDPYIRDIAQKYLNSTVNTKLMVGHTALGARSGGGGWHVDKHSTGIKALLYLKDVTGTTGPFEMLTRYSKSSMQHDSADPKGRNTYYTDKEVISQLKRGAQTFTVTGKSGTLVLFDTSNVHRGAPCLEGDRYSFTLYHNTGVPATSCN